MKKIYSLLIVGLIALSCQKEQFNPRATHDDSKGTCATKDESFGTRDAAFWPCGLPKTVPQIAGQNFLAGSITVDNNQDFIRVRITSAASWKLIKSHLYVGKFEDAPTNKPGNPKVGNFPYQVTHDPNTQSYTFTVPLGILDGNIIVAIHSEVANTITGKKETAWGDGLGFLGNSWATYISYQVKSCLEG